MPLPFAPKANNVGDITYGTDVDMMIAPAEPATTLASDAASKYPMAIARRPSRMLIDVATNS